MVCNLACYCFAPMQGLPPLRQRLLDHCRQGGLKGTILLAPEGINLFVAGDRERLEDLVAFLQQIPGLANLDLKWSESQQQPFSRMLVRLKKEIIAFGMDGIDPVQAPAPRLTPQELKSWLDEGRPLVLLDTRNEYEIKLGTFRGAISLGIDHFRDFPQASQGLSEALKSAPVVTFCTGGIRCEKAAPWLQKIGFEKVWQLQGGILRYFEEVGGAHYQGECFVFDQRVGVDPALCETESVLCFACQQPLSPAEQADPRYRPELSCPHCYREPEKRRQSDLDRVTQPLPGSIPSLNRRPLRIPGFLDGASLGAALARLFPQVEPQEWSHLSAAGHLLDPQGRPADLQKGVRAGEEYLRLTPEEIEPPVNASIAVVYEDEALLVLNKPAPLPMHPCGRFQRNTLQHILRLAWHPEGIRPAHRLDANTTGVLVCAKSRHASRLLQPHFELAQKVYRVRVHGHPPQADFEVDLPIAVEPEQAGLRGVDPAGKSAHTRFEVLAHLEDGTSLLQAYPSTGRSNQIRIHLWHLGHPVVGDPAYLPEGKRGQRQTLDLGEPPLHLHCWQIALTHPFTRERLEFRCAPPWSEGLGTGAGRSGHD